MKLKDVWVIIPAHNEERHIGKVIKDVKYYCDNIVIVDDGSKDKTVRIAELHDVIVLKHIINLGKGAALKTGCEYALKQNAKAMIVMDSDGQHKAKEIPNFVNSLKNNDIVFGYRKMTKNMPMVMKIGNIGLSIASKIFFKMNIKDTQNGYRAFTSEAYKRIRWKSSDYSVESEIIANVRKANLKYTQIPIETIYLNIYKGTTIFNGIKIFFDMLWYRLTK